MMLILREDNTPFPSPQQPRVFYTVAAAETARLNEAIRLRSLAGPDALLEDYLNLFRTVRL